MTLICPVCGATFERCSSHVNRSLKRGDNLYCGQACAGLARRKSVEHKKETKRLYDANRRQTHKDILKVQKAAWFKRTYNPEKQRAYNQAHMQHHVAYCRRPEYKEYKREYDARRRAELQYGEFGEAFMLLLKLEREVAEREEKHVIAAINGTLNKKQTRRRDYERANGGKSQGCFVDNSQRD